MNESITLYKTDDGYQFYGSSKEKIYMDKVSALASKKIFRRCKDLYDLYLLSMLDGYNLSDIVNVFNNSGRTLGDFEDFINSIEKLEYAYNQMRAITNKPEFNQVYGRVRDFCLPFITNRYKIYTNAIWQPKGGVWIYK